MIEVNDPVFAVRQLNQEVISLTNVEDVDSEVFWGVRSHQWLRIFLTYQSRNENNGRSLSWPNSILMPSPPFGQRYTAYSNF